VSLSEMYSQFKGVPDHDDEGTVILLNVKNYYPVTALHARRLTSSVTLFGGS
jgi:hypothetical protein